MSNAPEWPVIPREDIDVLFQHQTHLIPEQWTYEPPADPTGPILLTIFLLFVVAVIAILGYASHIKRSWRKGGKR